MTKHKARLQAVVDAYRDGYTLIYWYRSKCPWKIIHTDGSKAEAETLEGGYYYCGPEGWAAIDALKAAREASLQKRVDFQTDP
jgi:hypothetical protein